MIKKNSNVLVTGGMGFIGKYLTRKLLSETSYQITIVDNLSSSILDREIADHSRVSFYCEDFETWIPEHNNFKQIYHLTSPVGPLGVLKYKGEIAGLILGQLYKGARLAQKSGAKLLEISTSEVYGSHPEDEEDGQREDIQKIVPADLTVRLEYGVAKLLCEIVLKNLARDTSLNYVCVRPFNIVGPKQNGDLGFIIPRFIEQSLSGKPFTVYGDGSQKRTFTHVSDFVDAIYLLMENKNSFEVYNVGNPKNISTILDLAIQLKESLKSDSEISFINPETIYKDFAEAWNKIPNIDRIKSDVGWSPKYDLAYILCEVKNLGDSYLLEKNPR
jgi:UDP-glucose 4-epimerase